MEPPPPRTSPPPWLLLLNLGSRRSTWALPAAPPPAVAPGTRGRGRGLSRVSLFSLRGQDHGPVT